MSNPIKIFFRKKQDNEIENVVAVAGLVAEALAFQRESLWLKAPDTDLLHCIWGTKQP